MSDNIEKVFTLTKAGFSQDEIRKILDLSPVQEAVPEVKPESAPTPVPQESDPYSIMMNEFKASMDAQMEKFTEQMNAFQQAIRVSNVHQDVGGDQGGPSVQDVIANIIRPSYNTKGD